MSQVRAGCCQPGSSKRRWLHRRFCFSCAGRKKEGRRGGLAREMVLKCTETKQVEDIFMLSVAWVPPPSQSPYSCARQQALTGCSSACRSTRPRNTYTAQPGYQKYLSPDSALLQHPALWSSVRPIMVNTRHCCVCPGNRGLQQARQELSDTPAFTKSCPCHVIRSKWGCCSRRHHPHEQPACNRGIKVEA